MSQSKFSIPHEFRSELEFMEPTDSRTDADIIAPLRHFRPVASERNIWAFWHTGIDNLPPWILRNVIHLVRINGPSWTVRVLDSVSASPNNVLRYIPTSYLPEAFVKKSMTGPFVSQHSSDFCRSATLYLYGGVFMDVGNIPIAPLDFLCWDALSDCSTPYNVAVPLMYAQIMANHFVAARKGDPFVKRWHDLFLYLWQDRTESTGLSSNPLLQLGDAFSMEDVRANKFDWKLSVPFETFLSYIAQIICWTRLCILEPPNDATGDDAFNTSAYFTNNILTVDILAEVWTAESILGFANGGEKIFDILSTRLDADPESERYKIAYQVIWRLLTRSSMQKVGHTPGMSSVATLGDLLDRPENKDIDHDEETFGGLLRYGALHFKQIREKPTLLEAKLADNVWKKGLTEP